MKINFLIDESSNWKRIMLAWGQVSESNFHWFMIELAKVNGRYHHHHQIVSYYYLPNVTDRRNPFATGIGSWKFNLPSVVVWIKRVGIIQTRLAWLAYTMHLLWLNYAEHAELCWTMLNMLNYAELWWTMLNYAELCWTMLNYAELCWIMLNLNMAELCTYYVSVPFSGLVAYFKPWISLV